MLFEQSFCDNLCKPQNDPNVETGENICSTVQTCLDKIITKEGYENYDIKINELSTEGGNYLGDLYEVDVKGQTKNGTKETNIFVKHKPKEHFFSKTVSLSRCYSNEIFIYEEIENIMEELYDEAHVPENERFKIVKFYTESSEHALFLENLSRTGYETLDRRSALPLNFAKAAFKELAKFHAITFILKEKRFDFFEKKIETLKSPIFFYRTDDATTDWWKDFITKMLSISFDAAETEFEDKKKEINRLSDKMLDLMATNSTSRLSSVKCMCHGDIKPGNILWKQNDEGEAETIFIDYQLLNYGTPIHDFLYFIYMGTDRKFRKDHLDYLKNLYHDSMTEFLKYFDMDINSYYPRHVFENDFKEKLYYGLLFGLFYLPLLLNEDTDSVMSSSTGQPTTFHSSFKGKINGIFQEYIEWGIL